MPPCQRSDEIAGNFSGAGLAPIYDPTTLQQFTYNGTPNVIPPDRITDAAKALLALLSAAQYRRHQRGR